MSAAKEALAALRDAWAVHHSDAGVRAGMAVVAALLLAAVSSPLFALAAALVGALAWLVATRAPGHTEIKVIGGFVLINGLLLLSAPLFRGTISHPGAPGRLPDGLGWQDPPTPANATTMQRVAPNDPVTWLISSTIDSQAHPTDAGVVDLERALLIDSHRHDAALILADRYLAYGGPAINADIAAYYLAIAGGSGPPGLHHRP